MHLIRLPDDQPVQWLFVDSDPTLDGCGFEVQRHVEYTDEAAGTAAALADGESSDVVFGRSTARASAYKRFIQHGEAVAADVEILPGKAIALSSWKVYAATCRTPHSVMLGRWSKPTKKAPESSAT